MTHIGREELRLTLQESKVIARLHRKTKIADKTIREIHENTQGWAAGLLLMLESIKKKGVKSQAAGGYDLEGIFDYFAAEILERTDREVRDFLLKTAFLPSFTALMAENLTGQSKALRILLDLNRNNYFTEKRFSAEPVYQYHPLLREFLISCVKDSFRTEEISNLQSKAALLLEESGYAEDAAGLYRESADWEGLTGLIMKQAQSMLTQGRNLVLEKWLRSVPDDIREGNPWLLFWMGACRMPYNPAEAQGFYERAFDLFKEKQDIAGILLSWAGVVDSQIMEFSTFESFSRWIGALEELLEKDIIFPSAEIEARVTSSMFAALLWREPWHSKISIWAGKVKEIMRNCPDISHRIMNGLNLLTYYLWRGDIYAFSELLKTLESTASSIDISPVTRITLLNFKGIYGWYTNKPEVCRQSVSDALKVIHDTGVGVWEFVTYGQGAAGCLSEGDLTSARKYLLKMESLLNINNFLEAGNYHHYSGWHAALKGDIDIAVRHLEKCLKIVEEAGYPYVTVSVQIELAGLLLERGDYHKALDLSEKALYLVDKIKSMIIDIRYYFLKALISFNRGKEDIGKDFLCQGMRIMREQGIINFLFWRPSVMALLCARALDSGIETDYVKKLIRSRNLAPDTPPVHVEDWPWPLKIYTMGRFEVLKDGSPVRFAVRARQKPLEMLKALVAMGGRDVREENISDILWPESDGDAAHTSFATTLHRLRNITGSAEIPRYSDSRLSLDPRHCMVDSWAFERLMSEAERKWGKRQNYTDSSEAMTLTEKALGMYKGHFLANDSDIAWTIKMRERLRSKFLRNAVRLCGFYEQSGQFEKAVEYYKKGLEADELAEELYRGLIKCYRRLGRKAEALAAYKRCCETLSSVLGIEPSPEMMKIYKSLL
jgi:DNA-binding SARP family transcriptional activator